MLLSYCHQNSSAECVIHAPAASAHKNKQHELHALWGNTAQISPVAESQTLLGNGKTWGHPKPRQGGFAKCHPQALLALLFLHYATGLHLASTLRAELHAYPGPD